MEIKKAVITAIANQQDAIDMSVYAGIPQCLFVAMATTDSSGGGAAPTHCWGSGLFEESIIALYEADNRFQVLEAAGRTRPATTVLLECSPPLYPWNGGA